MPVLETLSDKLTDLELENALLSSLSQNKETYYQVTDYLTPEVFTGTNKSLFEQIQTALLEDKNPPFVEGKPAGDALSAAKQLCTLYCSRQLSKVLAASSVKLHQTDALPLEIITSIEGSLTAISQEIRELKANRLQTPLDLLPPLLKTLKANYQQKKEKGISTTGLPTGISKLDSLLGGLQTGLHLLAGEPGQGKTTFALQLASHIAKRKVPVLFVSFEEALPRLALKSICQQAKLNLKKFTDANEDPAKLEESACECLPLLSSLHFLEGNSHLTISHLKAKALQIMRNSPQCFIVIDYLQRWASCQRHFNEFRHNVSVLVSELRELSLRLECPILLISSQNRSGQGSDFLTSFKESGDIEYSCDTALFLVKADRRIACLPARAVDLSVKKNRYGDIGEINLVFRPEIADFREEQA